MSRQPGRLAVLELAKGEVSDGFVTVSGQGTGFTGFDPSIQGTSEDIPGGGALRTRDTGHVSGTAGFGVDHQGAAPALLWDGHADRFTARWHPEGKAAGKPYEQYRGFAEVTVEFAAAGAIAYSVTLQLYEAPTEGVNP